MLVTVSLTMFWRQLLVSIAMVNTRCWTIFPGPVNTSLCNMMAKLVSLHCQMLSTTCKQHVVPCLLAFLMYLNALTSLVLCCRTGWREWLCGNMTWTDRGLVVGAPRNRSVVLCTCLVPARRSGIPWHVTFEIFLAAVPERPSRTATFGLACH